MSELKIIFADVGQGDCTLLQLPDGRNMLVDIFRCKDHGIDIFKLLDDVLPDGSDGKKKLDILVVTHAHDDHITGLAELYDRYEVEWLWVPQYETRKQLDSKFGEYQDVVDRHPEEKTKRPQGSRTPLNENDADYDLGDGVTLRCFSPPGYIDIDDDLDEEAARKVVHEHCLVLLVAFNGGSVLLTGDSDLACWQRIESYYPDEVEPDVFAADILHATHHGSRTFVVESKGDQPWLQALEAIDPSWVVVSVGEDNRHDHPHPDMMKIYRDQVGEDNVLETRLDGTVVATIADDGNVSVDADTGSYAEDYGWDDEDGGDDDGAGGDDDGGGGSAAAVARPRSRTRLDPSASA
jgi:competence protein ComEC